MTRQVKPQVVADIALIKAEFPVPAEAAPVIEAYLRATGENVIEDV